MELNTATPSTDFFDLKDRSAYKVWLKAGECKRLDPDDALAVVGIFAGRVYAQSPGYEIFNELTFYPHIYTVEIEHPDGRLLQAWIDGAKLHKQIGIISDEDTTVFDMETINRNEPGYDSIKRLFKKYITDFGSVPYVDGETLAIRPAAPFGYLKDAVELSEADTREALRICNSGWNSSWEDVGSVQRIMTDRAPLFPYGIEYKGKPVFIESVHRSIDIELSPEQFGRLRRIFDKALEKFNGKHEVVNNIYTGFATYKNGILHGKGRAYDTNGKLREKYEYLDGELIRLMSYDRTGKQIGKWEKPSE